MCPASCTKTHTHTPLIITAATWRQPAAAAAYETSYWGLKHFVFLQKMAHSAANVIMLLPVYTEWRTGRHPKPLGK